ncbi:MAG TPA: hypothetical protein VEJ87_15585 [Acidimicrobiales bacterium]|nr:hypothetical protein [Acidimicrobiales bacterium]
MPKFEVFTRRRGTIQKSPTMTLQIRGGMGFNQAAYEALGKPEAVELLYAKKERIIGVRATEPGQPHAYPVRAPDQKRDSGFLVGGRSFTNYYDIDTSVARRYPAYMEGGILCVDLNGPSAEVTGPRAGSRVRVASEPENLGQIFHEA